MDGRRTLIWPKTANSQAKYTEETIVVIFN